MALTPFAKVEDLQVLAPALTDADAQLALEMVSASIRASVHWDVDRKTGIVYERLIPYRRRATGVGIESVILPWLNVTAIAEVKVSDVIVTGYDWTNSGIVYLHAPATDKVKVTFTAGFKRIPDEAPGVFRAIALEYAVKLSENPGGVRGYTMGQVSEQFEGTLQDALDDDFRLDPYRVDQQ